MASWKAWNWWKIAFFLSLVALEGMRELFVLESSEPPQLATVKSVTDFGDLVHAEGKWIRNDQGKRLMPLLVTIECNREQRTCVEASTRVLPPSYVVSPTVEMYAAAFGTGTVDYDNGGSCINYHVRIDLKAKEAYQTRTRTSNRSANCKGFGENLSARLGNGWDDLGPPLEGHFLPMIRILKAGYDLFR
jgi:hypothetical protein